MDQLGLTWRKSSRSNANGGECVEVATLDSRDRRSPGDC
jgi:Domain of unknown function (DUF397)